MVFLHFLISLMLFMHFGEHQHEQQKWGQVGHYVTGQIADHFMTDTARERVKEILDERSIVRATVWMDDVRSDHRYNHTHTWHWATIPDGMTYEQAEQDEGGDVIWALEKLIAELKEGDLTKNEERDYLKMVMHMVGDIHQPLHVGNGEDMGGNRVRVQWMGQNSNLHRVWDTDIIMSLNLSYTELTAELLQMATPEKIEEWQNSTVRDWAYESVSYRDRIYDIPGNLRLSYEYRYNNLDIVFERLLQAGVRLAGVLNEIYDQE